MAIDNNDVKDLVALIGSLRARVDANFEQTSDGFGQVNQAIFALSDRVNNRFAAVDKQFAEIGRKFAEIDQKFTEIDARFADINQRLDHLSNSLNGGLFDNPEAKRHLREAMNDALEEVLPVLLRGYFPDLNTSS